ncbi:hypothetical protein ACEPAG_7967 [Sanghuangporus baumii]
MSNLIHNFTNQQQFSICPANGRQAVGDGAYSVDAVNSDVLAVCQVQGSNDIYYYSTTFSGGSTGISNGGSLDSVRGWPVSRSSSPSSSDSDSSISSASPSSVHSPIKGSGANNTNKYPNVVYPHTPPHSNPSLNKSDGFERGVGVFPAHKDRTNTSVPPYSTPRDIPIPNIKQIQTGINNKGHNAFPHNPATPPLTPDSSPSSGSAAPFDSQDDAAYDFLVRLFPGSARVAQKYGKSVRISSSELAVETAPESAGFIFEGVVLDVPGRPRTLYIDGKGAENVKLRESIVALLDLADEHLECSALVIALERSSPALAGLLHSFMYVGASVVTHPPYPVDDAYVLVGIEI